MFQRPVPVSEGCCGAAPAVVGSDVPVMNPGGPGGDPPGLVWYHCSAVRPIRTVRADRIDALATRADPAGATRPTRRGVPVAGCEVLVGEDQL